MTVDYKLISKDANILVVDDTAENLVLLTSLLEDCGYHARPVPNGRLALQAARSEKPDLVLLDITMPEMDGYEVCERLKQDDELKDIPVLFISALTQTAEKLKAFKVGGIDYITKPFQFEEVKARVDTHLRLNRLQRSLQEQVARQVEEISESQMGMIFGLAKLAEKRDNETGKHLERIQILCQFLAEELVDHPKYGQVVDSNFCDLIFNASPLHDIGKVGIPDEILLKPGRLTPEEFEVMKTHVTIGADMLQEVHERFPHNEFIKLGIDIARTHHEKWNGKGYPNGLAGEGIPLSGRIMAIVDVYDAVRSKRVYKPAVSHEETCAIIIQDSGEHFDPDLVEVFERLKDQFDVVWQRLQD
ncbi:MAG: cyclic di-GMP phosphodiesterase [Chloroflexota bacterium]|nr:cyclic di-GMP phosphodiesterase [Chloroflexota bacterium]